MCRSRRKMNDVRLWVSLLLLQSLVLSVVSTKHLRRSMASHSHLPVSKSGWRPVVGSSGLLYGSLNTAPLHAPYKQPIQDYYQSTGRPVATRDATKLTSIAQSYRPTTLRTVPVSPAQNQAINSYLNPFALPNNGLSQYKFVQNYPTDNIFRNTHNPYLSRPVYQQKQQAKQKLPQQYHNNILQTLTSVQPINFGQYSTPTPVNILGNPVQVYARPDGKRPQSGTEIYKQEVYKLQDNDPVSQSVTQQVKTAQQQSIGTLNFPNRPYFQYSLQDLAGIQQLPPSIIGSFGPFAVQTVKTRDPAYPTTKATYQQSQQPLPTKQTFFSPYNFPQTIKTTPTIYSSTPKVQPAQNQLFFSSTFNDLANVPTPRTKPIAPTKIDPNSGKKTGGGGFKPSPQDPFSKQQTEFNKITTYNPQATPITQVTSAPNQYYDIQSPNHYQYNFNIPNTQQLNYDQQTGNINYNQQQQFYDNIGLNQQVNQQYINAPGASSLFGAVNSVSYQPTYEVTDKEADDVTHASTGGWLPDTYETNQKVTEETISKPDQSSALFTNPTTVIPEPPEEYAIVTEPETNYENGYNYESNYDTQSRRPLGDDFEPIGQHKLKDYYYKVSTPSTRRTKKPSKVIQEGVTEATVVSEEPVEALPTLPPNQHFRRPSASEAVDKDKIRKRNKIRRRRPIGSRIKEESTTAKITTTTTDPVPQTTEEVHTIRPRIRPVKSRTESPVTTVSATTDLTTSALPTISPTTPTVMKKKLSHQRFLATTTGKTETTTHTTRDFDHNKESPIMKIANRPPTTKHSYEYKTSEVPDYSHKQDEKDTPTSDIAVSLADSFKNTADILKEFSFHRDVRPMEITTVAHENTEAETTTTSTTARPETTRNIGKIQRPKLKLKHDRPKFSVKDYRNRLSSTTSSTEKSVENTPKPRPQRKNPYAEINVEIETTTERKRFTPKEPRHKLNRTENNEQEIHSRLHNRQKTTDTAESTTQKISARIRNGQRRPKPTEETIETSSTIAGKRPLRKKIKDSETGESVQDVSINETLADKNDITSERTRSESAIMKIADKKHQDHIERLFEHSKRVSDLTLAASKDYNTPGMFKTVSSNSRRIPNYFTIATDDPILPIQAFFPQLNQKKES
ncbi:uncharacterized protein LOC110999944 [Pieris rapae]|uniref:uncharacterized protein LOC110999944 n=1 Tax=Pieris rapae TaxID=64459 RepID=UPI001E2815C9|nr:uncharacterized protein LOC110999944 [Pieris rapae]